MPFITEEIYQTYFKKTEKDKSIHISLWPVGISSLTKVKENSKNAAKAVSTKENSKDADKSVNDKENSKNASELDLFIEILTKIRQEKSNAKKSMKAEIILSINKEEKIKIADLLEDLKDVTNAKEIKEGEFKVEFV
jgi:valyl-tRNA synthetase